MLKKIIIFLCCTGFGIAVFAKNPKVDSLIQNLESVTIDSLRATKMSIIGREMVYSQPNEAIVWLRRSLSLAKKSKGVIAASNAYITLADYHYFTGNIDSSYHYTLLSIAHNEKYADKEGLAIAYSSLARYYADNGRYLKSVDLYKKSLALFPNKKSMEFHIISVYIGIGNAYFRYGAYNSALKFYKDAYNVPNAIDYEEHHSITINAIGQVHFKLENYDKAMDLTLLSLAMLEKQGSELGVGISLFNIGEIMFATEQIDSALYYNDKGFNILKNYAYPAGIADCERLYGDIAMHNKEYAKAEKYYASAVDNFAAQGFTDRQTSLMISQAKALTALEQYAAADKLLQATLNILAQKTSLEELADCYKALRDNASKQGDFETAQSYTKLYDEAFEDYLGEKKIVATIDSGVSLDIKVKELQLEKRDLIIGQQNRNISIMFLVGGLIMLLFIAVTFYLRNKAQTAKANAIREVNKLNIFWKKELANLETAQNSKEANNKKNQTNSTDLENEIVDLPQTVLLNSATLYLDKIYYIEAADNYTVFYGKTGEIHREVRTLKSTAELLSEVSSNFKQVQRSFIVNELYIEKTFQRKRKKLCLLINGAEVPISNNYEPLT